VIRHPQPIKAFAIQQAIKIKPITKVVRSASRQKVLSFFEAFVADCCF